MVDSPIWDGSIPAGVEPEIVKFESDKTHPYRDSRGIWTVGDGDTTGLDGKPITANSPVLTEAQVTQLLNRDLAKYGPAIRYAFGDYPLGVKPVVPLYSFTHNLGTSALVGTMIVKMTIAGRPDLAARQLPGWCLSAGKIVPGLQKRRWAEMLLMLGADLETAYNTAWAQSQSALDVAYHTAFSDAAAWQSHPDFTTPLLPAHLVTVPATKILTADDLNAMSLDGTLTAT